jgi:hypothetical protein
MFKLAKTCGNMVRVLTYACIATFVLAGPALATSCSSVAVGSAAYIRATEVVSGLPEFQAWATHSFPIAFNAQNDGEVVVNGRCYWSVSVYADRPERLELWHIFAVHIHGGVSYVQSTTNGAFISLKAWRTQLQTR